MALKNIFNILVDLKIVRSINQPLVTQNDSVVFILEVMDNGVPFDLTDTTTMSLAHTRRDGTVVVTPGTKEGNIATFELGTNETAVAGGVIAKAQFYDADGRVSTLSFGYTVGVDPTGSGYVPSEVEQTLIQVVMADAQAKIDELSAVDVVELSQQLAEKADGLIYRSRVGGTASGTPNVIAGYEGNEMASDIGGATISGGGSPGYENIIGGSTVNVGTSVPNVADLLGTGGNLSVIGGGYDNVANGLASALTGFHCLIEKEATHGTIGGGSFHKITGGDYGSIGGGTQNLVNKTGATVAGGVLNTASGISATVVGGNNNTSSGNYSVTMGDGNTASATNSVAIGRQNIASGTGATAIGDQNETSGQYSSAFGYRNQATHESSHAVGNGAKGHIPGMSAQANGYFATAGDAQTSVLTLRAQSTDASSKAVGYNGAGAHPFVPNDTSWAFEYFIIARRTDVDGESAAWKITGIAQRGTGNASIVGLTKTKIAGVAPATDTWDVAVITSSTLQLSAIGQVGKSINWVGRLTLVQVTG